MKSLTEQLAEISKRCDEATEGPWKFTPANDYDDWQIHNSEFTFVKQDDSGVPVSKEDGEFIAHARTDIPRLLAVINLLIEQRDSILGYAKPTSLKRPMNAELLKILDGAE